MNHAELLKRLLPPGAYDLAGPVIAAELEADGNALDAAQATAELLLSEADPRTTLHMLADWERTYGLPDPCVGLQSTIALRRDAVVAKMTVRPGQSRAFFVRIAAVLGYTITITEIRKHTVMSGVSTPLYDWRWLFIWQVNAPLIITRGYTVMSGVNEVLTGTGNEILECVINKFKPAHTFIEFVYRQE